MLLVLMSVEKCFAVYFPLKAKTVCTVRTAKWATGVVGIILAGCDSVFFVAVESRYGELTGGHGCFYILDRRYQEALLTVDSTLYSYLLFTLLVMTNFAIALKFLSAKCKGNRSNSTESTNQALGKSATRGTAMVVTVSVTFLLLTAPTAIVGASYRLYLLFYNLPLFRAFINLTQYLNHSINGMLYCTVGSKFRAEVFKVIGRKDKTENTISIIYTDTRT